MTHYHHQNHNSLPPTAAPLYITIGPPCSGKTTWLMRLQQQQYEESQPIRNSVHDSHHVSDRNTTTATPPNNILKIIALDDQPGVYRALPASCFTSDHKQNLDHHHHYHDLLQERVVHQTILERIQAPDQAELCCLCRYVTGTLGREELETELQQIHSSNNNSSSSSNQTTTNLAHLVVNALEAYQTTNTNTTTSSSSRPLVLPATIDLFCRQVLFTRLPNHNRTNNHRNYTSAIDEAHRALRETPLNQPVAWGNTNLRPTDYQVVLQIAAQQGRPVHFVLFDAQPPQMSKAASSSSSSSSSLLLLDQEQHNDTLFDLPHAGLPDLMQRNLQRFFTTGRYVPSNVLFEMCQRSRDLWQQVVANHQQNTTTTPTTMMNRNDLQRQLARLAHYDRRANGTVAPWKNETQRKRPWSDINHHHHHHHNNNYTRPCRPNGQYDSGARNGSYDERQSRGGPPPPPPPPPRHAWTRHASMPPQRTRATNQGRVVFKREPTCKKHHHQVQRYDDYY